MPQNNSYFKVGAMTFAGLVLFLAGLLVFGLGGSLLKKRLKCVTYFNRSVQGLMVDSAVKFRGFSVGKVTGISLASVTDSSGQPVVKVQFEIDPKSLAGQEDSLDQAHDYIVRQTEQGLTAVLSFQGITGLGFLDLDFSASSAAPDYDQTVMGSSASPGVIYIPNGPGQIMEISESATQIVKSLSDVDFSGISQEIKKLVQTVDKAVADMDTAKLSSTVDDTLQEIRQAAAGLEELTDGLNKAVQGGTESSLAKELEGTVSQLRQTLKRLDQTLNSGQGNLPATLDNLRVMSENLRQLSELLKDQPSQAFFGQAPKPARPLRSDK